MASSASDESMVSFNVGGQLFLTTRGSLLGAAVSSSSIQITYQYIIGKDHMLARMIEGGLPLLKDPKGNIVLDRDGRCFQYILNYLRDGSVVMPQDQHFLELLLHEARYYCVAGLIQHLELKIVHTAELPSCMNIVRSEAELDRVVGATRHGLPALRLVLSRSNNKFSYVSNSDERLLDNFELFTKLATRFRNRISFFFETGNRTSDICSWYFYGHGHQLSEVSCVSMVYSSSHTQTRIDFPQGKLYEQAMNLLLYEPGLVPTSPTQQTKREVRPACASEHSMGNTSEI